MRVRELAAHPQLVDAVRAGGAIARGERRLEEAPRSPPVRPRRSGRAVGGNAASKTGAAAPHAAVGGAARALTRAATQPDQAPRPCTATGTMSTASPSELQVRYAADEQRRGHVAEQVDREHAERDGGGALERRRRC